MDAPFDLYLASQSPRRRELLELVGVRFRVLAVAVDETVHPEEQAAAYVERLARAKARAGVAARDYDRPVLGADTAVVCDDEIFGKPRDREDAARMLGRLAGRRHSVLTGVALADADRILSLVQASTVTMAPLTPATIAAYWATGEPCDKAGAYAIQGRGAAFISDLNGSYTGVMGLPLFETLAALREFGVDGFERPEDLMSSDLPDRAGS